MCVIKPTVKRIYCHLTYTYVPGTYSILYDIHLRGETVLVYGKFIVFMTDISCIVRGDIGHRTTEPRFVSVTNGIDLSSWK